MKFAVFITILAAVTIFATLNEWKKLNSGMFSSFNVSTLRQSRFFQNVWPTDPWFFSLVFSTLRHWFVCVLSILLTTFIHNAWLYWPLSFLNFMYVYLKRPLYKARREEWKQAKQDDMTDIYINSKRACDFVKYFTYVAYITFMFAYFYKS